jgi:hypothetical protein
MKGKLKVSDLAKWMKTDAPIAGKSDGGGLTFTLSAAGTASWVFRYRHAGKPRRQHPEGMAPIFGELTARATGKAAPLPPTGDEVQRLNVDIHGRTCIPIEPTSKHVG